MQTQENCEMHAIKAVFCLSILIVWSYENIDCKSYSERRASLCLLQIHLWLGKPKEVSMKCIS